MKDFTEEAKFGLGLQASPGVYWLGTEDEVSDRPENYTTLTV